MDPANAKKAYPSAPRPASTPKPALPTVEVVENSAPPVKFARPESVNLFVHLDKRSAAGHVSTYKTTTTTVAFAENNALMANSAKRESACVLKTQKTAMEPASIHSWTTKTAEIAAQSASPTKLARRESANSPLPFAPYQPTAEENIPPSPVHGIRVHREENLFQKVSKVSQESHHPPWQREDSPKEQPRSFIH